MTIKNSKTIILVFCCSVLILQGFTPLHAEARIKVNDTTHIVIDSLFRAYLSNDQRIQWSGQETSFGVESALTADVQKTFKSGSIKVFTQLFINQPFDKNILTDEIRARYLRNFKTDTIEIKQLYLQVTRGKITFGLGKHASIFGRDYTVSFSNSFFDYPFIRTEAVLNFETGLFFRYTPGIFNIDIAVTNGSEDRDTNSMKAGMVRIGLHGKNQKWSFGVSAKAQDGIGSEWQKQYKNHLGLDFMGKSGFFQVSGEIIYDEYGFHRDFPIDEIFWKRSYYYRDIFYKYKTPVTGVGGYIDFQYSKTGSKWFLEINYGEYHPKKIGHPYHDDPIRRAILKINVHAAPQLNFFGVGLLENKRKKEPLFKGASDYGILLGLQYRL